MPFSMNNLARIPWQGLDTRPYTPDMFGGGPIRPATPMLPGPLAPPGGGSSGPIKWPGSPVNPSDPWGPIQQGPGGGPDIDYSHIQARQPIDSPNPSWWLQAQQDKSVGNYTAPLDMASPGAARSYTSPNVTTNTATSNPISQAMQSYMGNLRSQVPQQYQQYLPANMGF